MAVGDNDDVIEDAVVNVGSRLEKGFVKNLQAKIDAAMTKVTAKVTLVADATGFATSARKALKDYAAGHKQPEYKVKLVADATGLSTSVRAALAKLGAHRVDVGIDFDGKDIRAKVDAAVTAAGGANVQVGIDFDGAGLKAKVQAAVTAAGGVDIKVGVDGLYLRTSVKLALAFGEPYEIRIKTNIDTSQLGELNNLLRDTRRNSRGLWDKVFPPLINFGGRGVKPFNLLIASLLALTPLLVSVGASAVQASASLTALGAAGIGAGLAIGGLVIGFKGVMDALKLRKSVQAEQLTAAANVGKLQTQELKNQKDINDARKQAIRDLETLRQKVRDLANEEKDDALTVAEQEQKRAKVQRNFFATTLDRARADQDLANARIRLEDTQLSRKQSRQDLADSLSKGVEGSDKVVAAKEAASSATKAITSPAAQLNATIAKLSPAARELYNLIDRNQGEFDRLSRKIQQATLPGFTHTLITLLQTSKGSKSSLEVFADAAGELAGKVGWLAHQLAHVTRTKWFRSDFQKIIKSNSKAFDILGRAAVKLVKPLSRIFARSAPLLERFAKYIEIVVDRFADWIEKADKSGKLTSFFKKAGDELGRWADLAEAVGGFLVAIFKAAVPSGGTVLERLTGLFTTMTDWANSPTGQKKIKDFFDKIANLPYGKIRDFIVQVGLMFSAGLAAKFMFSNPLWTLIGVLAASNPQGAIDLMTAMTSFIIDTLDWLKTHPGEAKTLLGILTAAKVLSMAGGLGKILATGGAGGAFALTLTGITAATLTVGAILGTGPGGAIEGFKALAHGPKAFGDWSRANRLFTQEQWKHWWAIDLPNALNLGLGQGGWTGLGKNVGHWFNTTLPNFISGKNNGWAGVGQFWFEEMFWAGTQLLDGLQAGIDSLRTWLWQKIRDLIGGFWNLLKKLLGINSPSTIAADMGRDVVLGLWEGFTDTWTKLYSTVTTWIDANITQPLWDTFSKMGESIRDAFISPWSTLTSALAKPVTTAFNWLNSNLIAPLNVLLSGIHLPTVGLLPTSIGAAAGTAGSTLGTGVGNAVSNLGSLVRRADGGNVPGFSPHSKADNIPALLTAGEWVQPKSSVDYYGTGFMEAVRTKQLPRYADGGVVGDIKKALGQSLVTDIIAGALGGHTLTDLVGMAAGAMFGGIGGGQVVGDSTVAETAEATARALGATEKQLVALIEAGIVESGMRNLPGGDRDSVGFLQQRPSQGWGSVAQIMNVAYATRKFVEKAKQVDKPGLSAGQLAQAVQVSAFPDRYARQEANAVAILNRIGPFLSGYGAGAAPGGTPMFGPWPASAASVHGHDSGVWRRIISLVPPGLNPGRYGSLYSNRRTDNGGWSWHAAGRAVDFMGYDQDELAHFFEARKPSVLELIHRSDTADYGISRGQTHNMGHEFGLHRNHLHVAMNEGGYVPARKYDRGGHLPPGYTLAFNGTGRNETVRTQRQEQQLAGGQVRLHKSDIALLATYIANTGNPAIVMDGRRVAEVTNKYTYLPAGV